jgi:uncharacterized damage-inducible protein DinB
MTKRIVLLQALASTVTDLTYILKGVEDQENTPGPTANSWTVPEVLAHFVYVENRYHERLQQVITEDNPTIPAILPDDTPLHLAADTAETFSQFKEARTKTLTMLKSLSPGQWQRPAVHEQTGKTTLRFLVQILIEHDIEHLNQIVELQQAARRVPVRDAQPAVEREE